MTIDRQGQITQLLQKLYELPDGEIKKSILNKVPSILTARESIEFRVAIESIQEDSGLDTHDANAWLLDFLFHLDLISQAYEFLKTDSMTVEDIPPGLKGKTDRAEPLIKELGQTIGKLKEIYS